jgi:Ca-activated chloride channel family protein
VASTRLTQVFRNDGENPAEGTYLFPLPKGAVVSGLVMRLDGQAIPAQLLDAKQARAIYEEIVRQWRDPALLEYVGGGAIQARVFPIAPRSEVTLEIEYAQALPLENGLIRYDLPLRPRTLGQSATPPLSLKVRLRSEAALGTIYSPTHRLAIQKESDFEALIGYESATNEAPSDFVLYYSLAEGALSVNLLTYRDSATEDGFFLLFVTPPSETAGQRISPRDVVVVLDQSGSMYGEKWEQAKSAAAFVLENLNPADRFNFITFSTGWRIYAKDWQAPAQAPDAVDWLSGLEAVGGTDINGALAQAFSLADSQRQTVVLFLTDGLATEGETETAAILENAKSAAPPNMRLFTFGVGDDVDTFLLDELAKAFRGAGAYVRPTERIDEEVAALYAKIAAPLLTDVTLSFDGVRVYNSLPSAPLPDLFIGTQFLLAGRYMDGGTATLTLSGQVDGQPQTYTFPELSFRVNAGGDASLPRLWATRQIGVWLNTLRLGGENPELIASIVRLSLRYGILTPYTSFLIQEEDILTPEGVSQASERAAEQIGGLSAAPSGSTAVEAADNFAGLAEAESALPSAAPGPDGGTPLLRWVADKTFLWQDGVGWVDTAYQIDGPSPIPVVFLSPEYFALLDTYPQAGAYLALGDALIVVLEGIAFAIRPN